MTLINYLHVGETTACGHCEPEKYGKGLKEAERVIPDFKCECKCHKNMPLINLIQEQRKDFNNIFGRSPINTHPETGYSSIQMDLHDFIAACQKQLLEEIKKEWEAIKTDEQPITNFTAYLDNALKNI